MTKLTWPQAAVLIALTLVGGGLLFYGKNESAVSLLVGLVGGWLLPNGSGVAK